MNKLKRSIMLIILVISLSACSPASLFKYEENPYKLIYDGNCSIYTDTYNNQLEIVCEKETANYKKKNSPFIF